jgi:hypothetical protein
MLVSSHYFSISGENSPPRAVLLQSARTIVEDLRQTGARPVQVTIQDLARRSQINFDQNS